MNKKERISKKIWITLFFLFLIIAIGLGVIILLKPQKNEQVKPAGGGVFPKTITLPIPIDHPNVTSVALHYFINGPLKELKDVPNGTQIILEGDTEGLPSLIITPETRIAKIAPPYGPETLTPISVDELEPGLNLSISIEYDLRINLWFVRDVFAPTDLNQ